MSQVKGLQKIISTLTLFLLLLGIQVISSPVTNNIIENLPVNNPIVVNEELDTASVSEFTTQALEILGGYGWDEIEIVKENFYMNDLKITLDNNDNVHLFWSERFDDLWYLQHKIKYATNETWSIAQEIAETSLGFTGVLDVKSDSVGKIHIIWMDDQNYIYYSNYDYGIWSDVITIDYGEMPRLQINNENKARIFYEKRVDYYENYYCAKMISLHNWEYQVIPMFGFTYYNEYAGNHEALVTNYNNEEQLYMMRGWITRLGHWFDPSYELQYFSISKPNESSPYEWDGYYQAYELERTYHYVSKPVLLGASNEVVHFIHPVIKQVNESGELVTKYEINYQAKLASGSWTTPMTLSDKSALKCSMDGAIDELNRVIFVWNHIYYPIEGGAKAGIYLKTKSPRTGLWTEDVLLNPGHGYSQYPSIHLIQMKICMLFG
jgi:hypothetical protein